MPSRNARIRDEHGCDNDETGHRILDGERIRNESTENIRGTLMEPVRRGQIRESEERPPWPLPWVLVHDDELKTATRGEWGRPFYFYILLYLHYF